MRRNLEMFLSSPRQRVEHWVRKRRDGRTEPNPSVTFLPIVFVLFAAFDIWVFLSARKERKILAGWLSVFRKEKTRGCNCVTFFPLSRTNRVQFGKRDRDRISGRDSLTMSLKYQGQLSGSLSQVPLSPNSPLTLTIFEGSSGALLEFITVAILNFRPLNARLLHTFRRLWKYFMSRYKQQLTLTAGSRGKLSLASEYFFGNQPKISSPLSARPFVCISESLAVSLILSVTQRGDLESLNMKTVLFYGIFPSGRAHKDQD